MATAMTNMKKWQDGYLTMTARVEEPIVSFTGKASESVADYVPERPQWAFLENVPTVTEFVDSQLKFRRRVVDQQAAFVRKMMRAMHPALVRLEPKVPAAKRPTAKSSTAKRSTAKRSTAKPSTIRRIGVKAA